LYSHRRLGLPSLFPLGFATKHFAAPRVALTPCTRVALTPYTRVALTPCTRVALTPCINSITLGNPNTLCRLHLNIYFERGSNNEAPQHVIFSVSSYFIPLYPKHSYFPLPPTVTDQVSHPLLNLRISSATDAVRQPSSRTARVAVSTFMTTDKLHSADTVSAAALYIVALY
jgi:hypothetical protein